MTKGETRIPALAPVGLVTGPKPTVQSAHYCIYSRRMSLNSTARLLNVTEELTR